MSPQEAAASSRNNLIDDGNYFFETYVQGSLGDRLVHVLKGLIQFILEKISSIFQSIIAAFINALKPEPCEEQKETSSIRSFDAFREKVYSDLPEYIRLQEQQPTYKREKLLLVSDETMNPPIPLNSPPKNIEFYANGATFYGYNAEGIRDFGWGCAWRTMQTSMSSYGVNIPFADLFHAFGPLQNLRRIYEDKYPNEQLDLSRPFAPYDDDFGWGEPFIGEMAMHFCDISATLEIVNGIPDACHAPRSVFHHPPLSFTDFKERLKHHFTSENPAPIIIDDGNFTLNVIGVGYQGSHTFLWIADPHIGEGVNRYPSEQTPHGLYTITLNENGDQIECSLYKDDMHQLPNIGQCYQGLHFNKKRWMILFPN